MADPDLEPRGGGDGGFVLLALPAFLPSVISSFIYPLNLNLKCLFNRSSNQLLLLGVLIFQ